MFPKIVLDLLIQLRKAFKVNVSTNSVKVKVHISARHMQTYLPTTLHDSSEQSTAEKEIVTLNLH